MSILEIKKYNDPVLRRKCKPVEEITPGIKQLVADMLETMYHAPGLGLAAPQVGVSLRICVMDLKPNNKREPIVLINPKFLVKKGKKQQEEGCLSLPGLIAEVSSNKNVKVEAINENGFPIIIEGENMLAVVLQHEIDHLEGKLFIDHLSWWKKRKIEREIKKRKKEGMW